MARNSVYVTLDGEELALTGLDAAERKLVSALRRRAKTHPDWNDFDNYRLRAVAGFYDARGLTRPQSRRMVPYEIAADLSSRLGIAAGLTRMPDYRDELEELIFTRFKSQREFCRATGLKEDMLSHVLARRKHVAIDTLSDALERIGYAIQIVPRPGRASRRTG